MTKVTVLGTGLMGSGIAQSTARAGLETTVWNRTKDKALRLRDAGIAVADDPRSAVRGADVVVTMLFDADAVESVMRQALEVMPRQAVWAQCATVGLDAAERLGRLAEEYGIGYVDAPVLGTRAPAEKGELTVLAGGHTALRDRVAPVFDAIGSRTIWVGETPDSGHRLKLAANAWVLSVTGATAQSVGLAERFGIDPRLFLETIGGGPLDCGYAQIKGEAMIRHDFTPSFSLDGAVKDTALIHQAAADAGADGSLISALHDCFESAARGGGDAADEDMAAVIRAFRPL
jgi:3-hydroxyisobutyrate dehydrogenase